MTTQCEAKSKNGMTLPTRKCPVDSFEEREGGLQQKKKPIVQPISFSLKIDVGSASERRLEDFC